MAVERDLLADARRRYDVAADDVTVEGVSARRSLESTPTSISAAGPITVRRHLYRPAGRSPKSIGPLELRAGIVPGLWTPTAARQGACVMAHVTSRERAMLCEELGGMQPSVSTLDRLPKTLSARFEAHREGWERDLRARETGPEEAVVLAVSLDGVMAPMAKSEPDQGAQTAQTDPEAPAADDAPGTRHYREAECQSIFALRPDLKVVKRADGAEEHWRVLDHLDLGLSVADQAQVEQVSITDFYHGADHVQQACEVMGG